MDVLEDHLDLAHLGRAPLAQGRDQLVDQPLGGGRARADPDRVDTLEPGRVDRRGLRDQVGLGAGGQATSTRQTELEKLVAPTTSTSWQSRARVLTAACRFWVA